MEGGGETGSQLGPTNSAVLNNIQTKITNKQTDLEVVIGNLTFLFLMNRPLLACLNHCYDFMAACYTEKRVLWKSVRHELRIARGLLIFARSDLDRPWHPAALMLDASLSGYSVAERDKDYALVQSVGEWDERWRFRRELDVGARARFVDAEASAIGSVRPSVAGPRFHD